MLSTVNHGIAVSSLVVAAVYFIYFVRSGLLRDTITPMNVERSHVHLAATIIATAVFGIATAVIMHFGAKKVFSNLSICLMLAWLVVEVAPGTLWKPAKKLDDASANNDDDSELR